MVAEIILLGLFLGTCCWILFPLFKEGARENDFTPKPVDLIEELENKKAGAYAVIKELEFDLKMGKLTEDDFQILKRQYVQEAIGYMKEIDELAASRASSPAGVDTAVEEASQNGAAEINGYGSRKREYIYCTSCGERHAFESMFCAVCGSRLHKPQASDLQEEN